MWEPARPSQLNLVEDHFQTEEERLAQQREKIKQLEREHERKVKARAQKLNFY